MHPIFKRPKNIIAIILLILMLIALPLSAQAATATASMLLNVRSGPGMSHDVLAVLSAGESVTTGKTSGNWCEVTTKDGIKGWASMAFLRSSSDSSTTTEVATPAPTATPASTPAPVSTPAPAQPSAVPAAPAPKTAPGTPYIAGVCSAASLNIRGGAGMEFDVVGSLSQGERVEVLENGSSWIKIRTGTLTGWVSADYLTINGESTEPLDIIAGGPTRIDNGGVFKKMTGDTPYMILINKETQVGSVLSKDADGYYTVPTRNFAVSSGKSRGATPTGIFTVYGSHRWRLMKGDVYCQYLLRFDTHLLTHSLTYSRRSPSTMSRTAYNKLGSPASSGCIRMRTVDAKWLYDNCELGTYVQIIDGGESIASIPTSIKYTELPSGVSWDPTDPTEGNPVYGMYQ